MRPDLIEADRVRSIVRGFFTVYDYYGFGLAESVYAGALEMALADLGHRVIREFSVSVAFKGRHVGWQRLDMVVDDRVIVEIKAGEMLPAYAERQLINYLRVSAYQVGLVLHFGPEPKFYRRVDTVKSPYIAARGLRD